jgi:hypothetical protein
MTETAGLRHDDHEAIRMLLPWYANNSLDAAERERVRAHLEGCESCAESLRHEQALRALISAPQGLPVPSDIGLARLKQRIRQQAQSTATQPMSRQSPRRWWANRPAIAAAALLAIAAPVAFNVHIGGSGKTFRTLASAPSATVIGQGNDIRIVFTSTLTADQRREILAPFDGLIVDGPNSLGAYSVRLQAVEPNPEALQKALDALRRQSAVRLAESIAPVSAP